MAAPKTTIWELEPHTRAKHEILKRYLQAWTPILSNGGFPHVLYLDGFAGPGRYSNGEDGSPIIALRAALDQRTQIKARVLFCFVEKEPNRAAFLQELLAEIEKPENFRVKVDGGRSFADAFADLHGFYAGKGKGLPPTFAFIDPFGWTGAPFETVKTILSYPSCEVFVTFMYEEINRFIGHPDQVANFDAFFGTSAWRDGIELSDAGARNRFLHDLYGRQLREAARARHVRSFRMRNANNSTDYYLFYATNSIQGLRKMKEAMWRVDESGAFTFSDTTDNDQLVLFAKEPSYPLLERQIVGEFCGREVTVGQVEEFVLTRTAFRETHYKVHVLKRLEFESPPRMEVLGAPTGRKRGTFGDAALRLRFR